MYGYGNSYMYGYLDPTYILVIIGALLSLWASFMVNNNMKKYSRIAASSGMTGAQAAEQILRNEGLYDVKIECLSGNDGDHFDPRSNTVRLSRINYQTSSITAVGVAAHECGHAIQHAKDYAPVNIRSALVPAVNITNKLSMPIILLGVILSWNQTLIQIGIWAFALTVIFQLVTLPVEFNASRRALVKINEYGLLSGEEQGGCKKVLRAAAFTYVAAAAATILQLLRLILLFGGNRRRDD